MKLNFLSLYLGGGVIVLMVFSVLCPSMAFATVSLETILVTITPENPAPNENTSITLNSYSNNLDSVLISWSIDGKNVSSGIGKKTFSLAAPSAGGEKNVVVTIAFSDGTIQKKITVRPVVMTLLWQADDSYVPPFYKGKAMLTPETKVKVVAIPEIKNGSQIVNPKNMIYLWKKDYTNNQDGSGYGKNSFSYTSDLLDDSNNISVTASTTDQNYSSSAGLDVGTTKPKIVFYKNDPILGTLWEQALGDGYKIQGNEIIEAAPYFISPKDIRIPMLSWTWSINGAPVSTIGFGKNLMPVKAQEGVSGTSIIRLDVRNMYKLLQSASREINVNF